MDADAAAAVVELVAGRTAKLALLAGSAA